MSYIIECRKVGLSSWHRHGFDVHDADEVGDYILGLRTSCMEVGVEYEFRIRPFSGKPAPIKKEDFDKMFNKVVL